MIATPDRYAAFISYRHMSRGRECAIPAKGI